MLINTETCPKCGSSKVKTIGKLSWFLLLLGFGILLIFIGILFFPVFVIGFLLLIFSPIGFLFPRTNVCSNCKNSWKVKKKIREVHKQNVKIQNEINPGLIEPVSTKQTIEKTAEIEFPSIKQEIQNQQDVEINHDNKQGINKQETISFNVAGVTYENDKNQDIQLLLRRIGREISKDEDIQAYGGWTNKEIIENGYEVFEFEDVEFGEYIYFEKEPDNEFDKNAIKVMVRMSNGKKYHIGYVPKKGKVNIEVGKLLDENLIDDTSAQFVGGKIKEVEYDDEKDKDVVVVNEITLGVEITLYYEVI